MVGGTSHRNRIIEISVLGQIVVLFENVFLDGASRGATQQLSSTAGFATIQFMRHGHEMLWFSRGSFSESELPLSYNAKVTNARAD